MNVREIRALDDADFAEWFGIHAAALKADDPTGPEWTEQEMRVRFQPDQQGDVVLWLAEDDGLAVGAAALNLPLRDNVQLAIPEVAVPPDLRRRGIGTALFHVAESSACDRGRTSLMTYVSGGTTTPVTPGTSFAERHGFSHGLTEIRRVQRAPFPFGDIERAVKRAEPHAEAYEIITWCDRVPDHIVNECARLEARLSTDAPTGDLSYEGEVWDEARVRSAEGRAAEMERGLWCAAAMSADGVMAAMTTLVIPLGTSAHAYQGTTIVDPEHRGHRLGLLVKARNLVAARDDRPDIQKIWTWNADSNVHMISINEIMGYEVQGWEKGYQRDIVLA